MPDLAVFIHVPKTGGTTLSIHMRRIYDTENVYKIDPYRMQESINEFVNNVSSYESTNLIMGHGLAWIDRKIERPCRYFTMLREPIRRVVSDYFYTLGKAERLGQPYVQKIGPVRRRVIKEEISLQACLEEDLWPGLKNGQTRELSGLDAKEFYANPGQGYARAVEMLERCRVVGLLERYDAFLILMRRRLGWKPAKCHFGSDPLPVYERQNTTSKKKQVREVDLRVIADYNELDLNLYEYAKERFSKDWSRYGSQAELFLYRNRLRYKMKPLHVGLRIAHQALVANS